MIKVDETDQRFYIKESTIPEAGLGLYANQPIKKGSALEIIGVMTKRNSVVDKCTAYANKYKFGASEEGYVIIPMGYAGIVNHADDKAKQNVCIKHVRAKITNKQRRQFKDMFAYVGEAVYFFLRDVEKDEEILGNYGPEWRIQQEWVNQGKKAYEAIKSDWQTFLDFGLYNMPLLQERLPL